MVDMLSYFNTYLFFAIGTSFSIKASFFGKVFSKIKEFSFISAILKRLFALTILLFISTNASKQKVNTEIF